MLILTTPVAAAAAALLAAAVAAPAAPTLLHQEPAPAPEPAADEDPPIPDCGDMQILPSGLRFCVLEEGGDGDFPKMGDVVRVDYTGWNLDGTVFDTSRKARPGLEAQPAEFPIGGLIDGWNEALQLMSPGDRWKLFVPADLAYKEKGSPPKIAPNADLVFEVELHEILERAPRFVAWEPEAEGVETFESGAALRVLDAGAGEALSESDLGIVEFACYNPGGGFVVAHTTQGGAMPLTKNRIPLPFMKEALPFLKPGARVLMNVPPAIGLGGRGGTVPNLPEGSNEIWILECSHTFSFSKPEFRLPADEELTTTESGLKYVILEEGDGVSPTTQDSVLAHYAGWLVDGTGFDNSYDRGNPLEFGVTNVIAGWTEGLQLMKTGGSAIFVIPPGLAYGERGAGGSVPPNATLVFHVRLLLVK